MSDIERWRAQLAEEDDSDDDGLADGSRLAAPPRPPAADDDLGLQLAEPRVSRLHAASSSRAAPPPLSAEGRELVLEQQVLALQAQLEQKELELEAATDAAAGTPACGGAALSDAREAKVREIVKRSKAAMMALGRERAKNAALLAELAAARRESGAAARLDAASAAAREARDGGAALEREAKEAKAHVAAMGAKLAAQKTANEALKAEVARYARALAREVGEEVGSARVRELLDEGSGAKGRAQQIALLKEQLRELARRAGDGVAPAADERQRSNLSGIEAERRRELERLLLRENQLVGEVAEAKKKVDAQAARIKILEGDVKSKKEKLLVLLRKSDADDQLVGALRAELEKTRAGGEEGKGEQLAQRVAQQQAQITRQEQIILSLRDQLQRLQDREEARPGSSPRQPHDLIVSQAENAKLRELVALLQDKLRDYEQQRR